MKHRLILLYSWLVRTLCYFLPDQPALMRFRGWLYSFCMGKCGKNFQVCHSVILNGLDDMYVGQNVYFGNFCHIISNGTITIGDNVLFGPAVIVSAGNHQYDGNSYRFMPSDKKDVVIEEGSWIASNVTIAGGSRIPVGSVVAANSCVTPSMQQTAHALYAGLPAKLIKTL
mgnify:CR=1 FL=1